MSQESNDDLARALEGLGNQPSPAAKPAPRPAQPAVRTAQPAAPAQPKTPAAQAAKSPQPKASPPGGKPQLMPRTAVRAAGGTTSTPALKAVRAASPLESTTPAHVAEAGTDAKKPTGKRGQSLGFRRTMIPILLTLGLILLALCATRFVWHSEDNPMLGVSPTMSIILGGVGTLIWVLAAITMAGVARHMRAVAVD